MVRSQAAIDRFADALWIEDGLAPLTLAAYRRDLSALAAWLPQADAHLTGEAAPRLNELRESLRMTARQASYTVIVGSRPGKAGIDPDNKLIDRKPDDNMVAVELEEP